MIVGARDRAGVLRRVEGRALDANAVRRPPRRKSRGPAPTAGERWKGHAGRAEAQELAFDVVDAEADVVQPVAVGLEPGRQRMSGVERLHELQPGVAQIE